MIFDNTRETRYGQKRLVTLGLNKKWGAINTGAYYRNFLEDVRLNSMGINAYADVKLI
jgi:hypothetical protein